MDRIRNAVTRARHTRDATAPESTETKTPFEKVTERAKANARPQPAPQQEAAIDDLNLATVECDFEKFGANRIIANEQDPVLNAYRVLRTRVLQKMEAEGWKTLAVVSPGSGAGKTVTAINLAIAISSKAGSRATLIDLDFYRPSVARYLGLKEFPSVLDYFEGQRDLRDVAVRPGLSDVVLIANERVTRRGAEHLTSDRADQLIDTSINDFGSRVVIFDMSPLLGCDDTIAFLPKVDCVLLVAASGDTRVDELKEARRILGKTNILGTVLNKAPAAFMPNQYY
ncbi:CpsD/CapB family tyrosine-protein kinase [Hyphococcus sp. DH-69]|uniref:CpsD/CapB family tyrosine-protein kinase n=1 Tax=Hyphococcus formosus TaxID=3143534 RepID=UPI00398B4560